MVRVYAEDVTGVAAFGSVVDVPLDAEGPAAEDTSPSPTGIAS
jgi:hypothetical protein